MSLVPSGIWVLNRGYLFKLLKIELWYLVSTGTVDYQLFVPGVGFKGIVDIIGISEIKKGRMLASVK